MKIRQGFVSNSSSSSFVINTKGLPAPKLQQLKDLCDRMVEDYDTDINIGYNHIYGTISNHSELKPELINLVKQFGLDSEGLGLDESIKQEPKQLNTFENFITEIKKDLDK